MTLETAWPWLTFAGLGMFHGLNPAMGWLFAVALGLHRRGRRTVQLALLPMAAGHALSIWLVAASVMTMGTVVRHGRHSPDRGRRPHRLGGVSLAAMATAIACASA